MVAVLPVLVLMMAALAGLTHLPRRAQVDEAVLPVELRRRENVGYWERWLLVYYLVNISGRFCRSRHGGRRLYISTTQVQNKIDPLMVFLAYGRVSGKIESQGTGPGLSD